jgi:hypothetical protein
MLQHDVHFPTPSVPAPAAAAPSLPASGSPEHHGSFFSELLDIINPLQHLPVIGTIYRAITGEHVDAFAKIAGDTLYGGVWGAATSVADVAFEAVTGKSAEDTVLAWFDSSNDGPKLAAHLTAPRTSPITASSLPVLDQPLTIAAADLPTAQQAAFTSALAARGVTGEIAQRALYAYQRSVLLTGQPLTARVN